MGAIPIVVRGVGLRGADVERAREIELAGGLDLDGPASVVEIQLGSRDQRSAERAHRAARAPQEDGSSPSIRSRCASAPGQAETRPP